MQPRRILHKLEREEIKREKDNLKKKKREKENLKKKNEKEK